MTPIEGPFRRSELEQAVHGAIERQQSFSNWPPMLRREYFRRNGKRIRQELRQFQVLGLLVTICSMAFDAVALPELLGRGVCLRMVLIVLPAIALLAFSSRVSVRYLKLCLAGGLIAFAAIATHLATLADPVTATRYTMGTTLLLALAIMVLPFLRDEMAGFALGYAAANFLVGLWPNPLSPMVLLEHVLMTLVVGGAALAIALRNGKQHYLGFLYDLRDSFSQLELEHNLVVLRELSSSDALTGLANRRAFRTVFDSAFAKGRREDGRAITVMMIDLDHFKRFNDEHGHQAGDRALRNVGRCLEECFSGTDGIIARFGGEEFIGAFPSETVLDAEAFAEMIRSRVSALEIRVRGGATRFVTTSIGLASAGANARIDLDDLIARADRALYRAKSEGRDRVVSSEKIELRVDRLAG